MASKTGNSFIDNLGRIYGLFTGGFLLFVVVLAILEQLGLAPKIIGWVFLAATIGLYALIGVISRTSDVAEYYVAGRRVPAVFNGMAVGSDWMSAASFIGMAGSLYALGYDGLAYIMGWTGGYVLVALFLAPYLRKFGQFTIPDFLGARYGGNVARAIGIVAAITASFTYVVAQIKGAGIITSRFLEIPIEYGTWVGVAGILVCSMLGGMRAVTWTQVAQYIVLIIAYLVPIVWLSYRLTGVPIPQLMYGQALAEIAALEPVLGVTKPYAQPFVQMSQANFIGLVFCLMIGTAALPHILMRFYTTPSVREARVSVGWSLFCIFLLYFSAPAYAAFAKLEVYKHVIGQAIANLPAWVTNWGNLGLITIKDDNGDGILQVAELTLNPDAIVLATPEIAGLPYVVAGLVAAGGLSAALSTADGLLLTISNALSHDLYYKMIDPSATTTRRLMVARTLLLIVAAIAAYVASTAPSGILVFVSWAFSIAGAAFFPALVLGIFWPRATKEGAIAGMLVGFGLTLFYVLTTSGFMGLPKYMEPWFGINSIAAGVFGIPAGFLTIIVVSLLTKAPDQEVQALIHSVRYPNLEPERA
ncbi:MAG TPA: sodium:solute symporter family protein [Candidatus Competibacteraceae bacterium]|nr:sodium:solute symporter family protein [Candidatus Competibacteraceae bacterium]